MMLLLVKYWREAVIASLILIMSLMYFYLSSRISVAEANEKSVKSELEQYKTALSFQNAAIETQRIDAEKLKNLPKTIERIKTRYVGVYDIIDNMKDNNETILFNQLNSFTY